MTKPSKTAPQPYLVPARGPRKPSAAAPKRGLSLRDAITAELHTRKRVFVKNLAEILRNRDDVNYAVDGTHLVMASGSEIGRHMSKGLAAVLTNMISDGTVVVLHGGDLSAIELRS